MNIHQLHLRICHNLNLVFLRYYAFFCIQVPHFLSSTTKALQWCNLLLRESLQFCYKMAYSCLLRQKPDAQIEAG